MSPLREHLNRFFPSILPISPRSAEFIKQTSGENSTRTAFHTLRYLTRLRDKEITTATHYLETNAHWDELYRMLIFVQQALNDYLLDPRTEGFLSSFERKKIINKVSILISSFQTEGFIQSLCQEIQRTMDPNKYPPHSYFPPLADFYEFPPECPPQFASPSAPFHFARARTQALFTQTACNDCLDHWGKPVEEREALNSLPGYQSNEKMEHLLVRRIASDAFVVKYRFDYDQFPRFVALYKTNHFELSSYPAFVEEMGFRLEGERAQLHRLLKIMHHEASTNALNQAFGVDITRISVRAQIFFMEFLHQASQTEINKFKSTLSQLPSSHKESYIKSFLACAHDPKITKKLRTIAQSREQRALFFPAYQDFASTFQAAAKALEEDQKPLFQTFQQQFIDLASTQFLQKFTTISSPEDQKHLCQQFNSDTHNAIEIFRHLVKTLQIHSTEDLKERERTFVEGAKTQLSTMIKRWTYPQLPPDFHPQVLQPSATIEMPEGACFPTGIAQEHIRDFKTIESGQKKAVQPAHMLEKIFWMNAQKKKSYVAVCHQIQTNNLRDPKDPDSLKHLKVIGDQIQAAYQRAIDYFGLEWVQITSCEELPDPQVLLRTQKIVHALSKNEFFAPAFAKAFTIKQKHAPTSDSNKGYLKTEIAWILATSNPKISPPQEALYGYDPLAAIIQNLERIAGPKVWEHSNSDEFRILLCRVLHGLRTELDKKLSTCPPDQKPYYQAFKDFCFGNQAHPPAFDLEKIRPPKTGPIKGVKNIKIPFVAAPSNHLSFGNSPQNLHGSIAKAIPYQTMVIDPKNPAPHLNNLPMENLEGVQEALLARIGPKKQNQHLKKTLIPLLRAYIANLPNFSQKYYQSINTTQNQLLEQINSLKTYLQLLRFIQQYVLLPSSR